MAGPQTPENVHSDPHRVSSVLPANLSLCPAQPVPRARHFLSSSDAAPARPRSLSSTLLSEGPRSRPHGLRWPSPSHCCSDRLPAGAAKPA